MRLELISNRGVNNLRQELESQLKVCNRFNMGSAFITEDGVELLRLFLLKNRNAFRTGRYITGLYNGFNSKKVLTSLKTLAAQSKGKMIVKISKELTFHWKYYHFESKNASCLYVGSANLTKAGIEGLGELQAKITGSKKEFDQLSLFKTEFDKEWEDAINISKLPIGKYKQNPNSQNGFTLHPDIRRLLSKKKSEVIKKKQSIDAIILIKHHLTSKTDKLIQESQSHWESNDWEYYSCATKKEFEHESVARSILLIEKKRGKYRFSRIHIKDSCVLLTPDGKYFIAYKAVGKSIPENKVLRQKLEEFGVKYHSHSFIYKYRLSRELKRLIQKVV